MTSARVWLLLVAFGCGSGDAEPPAPGPVGRGVSQVPAELQPKSPAPTPPAAPSHPAVEWPEERVAAASADIAKKDEPQPERDMSAELLAAVGDVSGCIAPRPVGAMPAASSELEIALEAHVVGAGSVSRSDVRAPQLTADEAGCIRRRVQGVRFATPIEDAPRAVRATLRLTLLAPTGAGS